MAFSQADVDALDAAIKTGIRNVRYPDGSQVEYQSASEMLRVRAMMRAAIAADNGSGGAVARTTLAAF